MPTDARDVCAIIVATKQDGELIWREVAGRRLLAWSVAAFESAPSIARILLVVPEAQLGRATELYSQASQEKVIAVLPGGARRRDGIEAALGALSALPDECAYVAIHDATRPLVTSTLIEAGIALARETGVAIPTEPVKETIKRVHDGVIVGAVPRERLARAQTPQVVSRALLLEAYQRAAPDLDPPDEAALLLAAGLPVSYYEGDPENRRVSSVDELTVVEELLMRRLG
ncbi:MAG TPA: 2-C-methyl-D-erythritol 4-phosphate cytidylyltransferase [Ktedonobacterales bacterium]|jgi:2-C-methyl-D-erythritol 4-phosphate cytidylyltransferase